jgi:transposase
MASNMQTYVGLDVHKKFIQGCILDEKGNLVFDKKFKNEPHEMDMFLLNVHRSSKIALESCSCWQYTFDYLQDAGYEVTLANPSRIRLIAESRKKTDKHDAMVLANLLRTNMLPTSYAAPHDVRMKRQIARHRLSLVNVRTEIKNKIHAILLRHGINSELNDIFTDKGIEWLQSLDMPMCDRFELDNYISILRHLSIQIDKTQERIEETASDDANARLIMTHPGISYYSALMITSEIGDVHRFDTTDECRKTPLVKKIIKCHEV